MSRKYEYEYYICNVPDYDIYLRQCAALEKHIPGLQKLEELHDVDDSRIQLYLLDGKKVTVLNDHYIGCVRIQSDIQLEPFFEKKSEEATTQSAPSDRQKRRKSALSPAPAN